MLPVTGAVHRALAEIMSSLHALIFRPSTQGNGDGEMEWFQKFNFVNDAGHAENSLYATRTLYEFDHLNFETLKGFRSLESKPHRSREVHMNPRQVFLSNDPSVRDCPKLRAWPLPIASSKTKELPSVPSLTVGNGGEAKEALAAIAGLAKKEKLNPFVLVISDNGTKLSGPIEEDAFAMTPTFQSLDWSRLEPLFFSRRARLRKSSPKIRRIPSQGRGKSLPTRGPRY